MCNETFLKIIKNDFHNTKTSWIIWFFQLITERKFLCLHVLSKFPKGSFQFEALKTQRKLLNASVRLQSSCEQIFSLIAFLLEITICPNNKVSSTQPDRKATALSFIKLAFIASEEETFTLTLGLNAIEEISLSSLFTDSV